MIIIMLIKRRKKTIFTLWEVNGSSFEQTWIPFTQRTAVPNLVEIGPAVQEMKIFKFCQCIFTIFLIISPYKRVGPFIWIKHESSSPKEALCQGWLKMARWFWRRLLNFINVSFLNDLPLEIGGVLHFNKLESPLPKGFGWNWTSCSREDEFWLFRNYLPRKKVGPFIWTSLNPLYPRMHCAKFGWNWPSGSEEDFKISSMYFCYFVIFYPWKRVGPFTRIKLSPHHPRILCAKFGLNWPSDSVE